MVKKLPALKATRRAPTVLTPHPGEMARLLKQPISAIQANREKAVKACAGRTDY